MAGFWADVNIEPKRAYRWLAYIGGLEPWLVKKFSKPTVTIGETEHKFLNHSFWYPGRATWESVSFTLADPVTPDASSIMFGKLMAGGYKYPDIYSDSISTISKAKMATGLGEVKIQQLGANAEDGIFTDPVETWTFINAWVKDIKFGELDYDSEDMVNIDVTIRYDYAMLEAAQSPQSAQQGADGAPAP